MSANGHGPRSLKGMIGTSLVDIVSQNHEPPDWLIDEILPQGAFLIVGRPKIGKSWFNLQLAITLSCGGTFLGFNARDAFDVIYFAAEDDRGRIASRFAKYASSAPPKLRFFCREDIPKLVAEFAEHYSLAEFIDVLLYENPTVKAVIIDTESTLRSMWDGGTVRRDISVVRSDYAEVREFDEIAHRRRAFVGLVNHTAKLKNGRWHDIHELINRTNASLAGASGSIVLALPPGTDPLDTEHPCKLLGIRGRDILKDSLLAVKQDEKYSIFESLGPYKEHNQTERESQILLALSEATASSLGDAEGWVSSKELAEVMNSRKGTISMALSRMIGSGRSTWQNPKTTETYRVEARRKRGYRLVKIQD